jgi:hypothetical protein
MSNPTNTSLLAEAVKDGVKFKLLPKPPDAVTVGLKVKLLPPAKAPLASLYCIEPVTPAALVTIEIFPLPNKLSLLIVFIFVPDTKGS